ncbi:MAG: hypothetical protein K2L93_05940 [Muribaculaceae bacterium]|nr:hypothetical protein [Muribaculaceae bacterium]MDE6321824.1 hypothetical protein [Muribaculaceae bacterium]
MSTVLLYIGIGLILAGWLSLSWFAIQQMRVRKEYGRMSQRSDELKAILVRRRWTCRAVILVGMIVLIISLVV